MGSDEIQVPSSASDDWAERRLKLDMENVSKRLLTSLIWYAFPVHHIENLNLECEDGETIHFTSNNLSIYGKHVAKFMQRSFAQKMSEDPEKFEAVMRAVKDPTGEDRGFDEVLLLSLNEIYPVNVFSWLEVKARLDPKSDDVLFDMNGGFHNGWDPAMTQDLLTVMQDYGMERAMQIKSDKHWDADHANFPLASPGMLAQYKKD